MPLFGKRKEAETSDESVARLPFVTEDTIKAAYQSHVTNVQPWGERLNQAQQLMKAEQLPLGQFIHAQIADKSPEIQHSILEMVYSVYSLLDQQAKTNSLSSKITLPKGK